MVGTADRIDDTDERILQILDRDSREPFADIAKAVNLSAPAVRRRIERMANDGTISRFTIERGDRGASAIVLVSVDSGHDTAQASEMLAELEGVRDRLRDNRPVRHRHDNQRAHHRRDQPQHRRPAQDAGHLRHQHGHNTAQGNLSAI